MSTRSRLLRAPVLSLLALGVFLAPAFADPVQVVTSDDHSVTLRLTVPDWRLELSDDPEGLSSIRVEGLRTLSEPGRPELPYESALLAVPPGATVSVRVLEDGAEEAREGVHLVVGDKPTFHNDRNGLGFVPAREPVEPIVDGSWPSAPVIVGKPFVVRGQRMVAVSLRPFRYDARERRLYARKTLTVRVEFRGGAAPTLAPAADDRHWEPVLQASLLNYAQGRAWRIARDTEKSSLFSRGRTGLTGGGAFDENFPEVRVKVDTSGVYAISFNQLVQANPQFPSLPIAQVSVHRHEFIEGATPPYVTAELPIEVDDVNGNNVFDAGDRIVMYVQDWAERSGVSQPQRMWGDAEVIFATYVNGTGLRVSTRAGWRNQVGLTPLASYPWTQRYERNFTYGTTPPDTLQDTFYWTEAIQLYYDRPDSFRFETNHLDVTHPARVNVTWQGRTNSPHYNWASVTNQLGQITIVADSIAWFGQSALTSDLTIAGNALTEGLTNGLAIWGKTDPGPPNQNSFVNTALNYFDITYWRSFRALNGYLPCNSADGAGETQIRGLGFPGSDIRVYDVSNPADPTRLTLDPSHIQPGPGSTFEVEFQDLLAGTPHQYFAVSNPRTLPASMFSPVTRQNLTNHVAGDYLLIVPEAFQSAVAPLVALRSQSMTVNVAPVEAVFDEFNGGRRSSYAIKRYVKYALDHWNVRFVLLVGDGKEDPQNFFGGPLRDWIPIHKIAGPVGVPGLGFEVVPSDPWYGCFPGPETGCDALYNSDALPVIPEVYVGRLPVNTLQQAQNDVAKIVAYESVTPDQTWRNDVLLHSDDAFSTLSTFGGGGGDDSYCRRSYEHRFRLLSETIEGVIHNEAGLVKTTIDPFVMTFLLAGEPTNCNPICVGPDTCRLDIAATQARTQALLTPQLIAHLNQGRLWWNYQGHANPYVLSHEYVIRNDLGAHDWERLENDGKPFLFSAFSCHVNSFAATRENFFGASLGEQLENLSNRGAIGVWASTGYEIIPRNGTDHINVTWARAMFSDPPRDEYLGEGGARVVLGETIATALLRHLAPTPGGPQPPPDYNERGVGLTYNLLGDPATRLSIGAAQSIVTANGVPVTSGVPVRLHTPGDTLRIEADLVTTVRIDQIHLERSNAAGTAVIPPLDYTITPPFPDTSLASGGGRRYHLTYKTTLVPETHKFTIRTVDRNGVAGSFDVAFQFLTVLRQPGGGPIGNDDPVPPSALLEMLVISPKPLVPQTELTLTVNGTNQPFTEAPAPGNDGTGREWVLSWTHSPYPVAAYEVAVTALGGGTDSHHFLVVGGDNELQIKNPMAFPNPFQEELGTFFSMLLVSGTNVDVEIRVFTLAGKLVYRWEGRGLAPGYHQIPWTGIDAEGGKLANGVYPYRILATNHTAKTSYEGRLVKLRRPHSNDTAP